MNPTLIRKPSPKGVTLFSLFFFFFISVANTVLADEYDTLRDKWKIMLTGGTAYNTSNTNIANAITNITTNANTYWSSMNTAGGRTYLWSDLNSTSKSSQITSNYDRLKKMALAYSTTGSSLKGNTALRADIISGLDWMYTNRYNENKTQYDNWWDWQIGSPLNLNDIVILIYGDLNATQITNYMNAINHFTPSVNQTGANRVWKSTIVVGCGIISKSSTKMVNGRDGLSSVFPYVTTGDGFYTDGSFIQHGSHPYTGGYGKALISDIANIVYILEGSTWTVTDSGKANIYAWVYNSYSPLMYKAGIMDMVRGREISRSSQSDHIAGHGVIGAIIRLSQSAPPSDAAAFKSMVKYWIQQDVSRNYFSYASINMIVLGEAIVNDGAISPMAAPVQCKIFANMDRAVQLRSGYGVGISMHSTRIFNYENINDENTGGDHTSDGAMYLYNGDLSQFSDNFWNTVNYNRIPGTTVLRGTSVAQSQKSSKNWVGGANLAGLYGTVGMDLAPAGQSLVAKKSWFMLDNEIVALGAGITNAAGIVMESIVENRKLNSSGNNAFTVNGTAKSTTLGWTENMTSVNWAHLQGNVTGADIGYYFPVSTTVSALREARTGDWANIGITTGTATKNYLTMYLDHGSDTVAKKYGYVILPNMSSSAVSAYAASPQVSILENSTAAQGVKEAGLGITAVNFWADASKTVDILTSNKKAAVIFQETASGYEISVADPTMANTGTITITINKSATSTISSDSKITVTQLSPTIILTINASGLKGRSVSAKFAKDASTQYTVDNTDAGFSTQGTWTTATSPTGYWGSNYLHDGGSGANTTDTATWVSPITTTGTYDVYMRWAAASDRPDAAPVEVNYNGGIDNTIRVNQKLNGGTWVKIGTWSFTGGSGDYVRILASDDGTTVADAVRWVPAGGAVGAMNTPFNRLSSTVLEAETINSGLQVYPNPASGSVNLSFPAESTGQAIIEIYSGLGQKVLSASKTVSQGNNNLKVDLNDIQATGVYYIKVISGSKIMNQTLMINK